MKKKKGKKRIITLTTKIERTVRAAGRTKTAVTAGKNKKT
jgi:hypothetical protein